MYLLSKYGKDGSGGVTGLEADGEWMCEKIVLCAFSVCVQGIADYYLKFGGRRGRRLRIRHERETESLRMTADIWSIVGQRRVVHWTQPCVTMAGWA